MRIGNVEVNSYQANFLKELMGEPYMNQVRLESRLMNIVNRYDVDLEAFLEAINKNFGPKNEAFKKLEAEELAQEA